MPAIGGGWFAHQVFDFFVKAGRGWHHHSRALRRRLMGQGE
jgi:hypothetical protein